MTLDRLWAGWRAEYIGASGAASLVDDGSGKTLFERILSSGEPDEVTGILHRGPTCFAILNRFPYTTGHLMVLPLRAVAAVEDLDDAEHDELWRTVRASLVAVNAAYSPEGVNIGANLGRAGGAGVPDHLHIHVVPRWAGDTNFMTAVAETRVLPEPLQVSWAKLREAWPS